MLRLRRVQTAVSVVSNGRADEVSWALGVREAPGSFASSSNETQVTDHSACAHPKRAFCSDGTLYRSTSLNTTHSPVGGIQLTPAPGRNSITILPDSQWKSVSSHAFRVFQW